MADGTSRPVRRIHEIPGAEIVRVNRELQDLLSERVPRLFPVEPTWQLLATGFLARMGAIVDGLTALVERGRNAEAEVALRTMYEHATVFCWLGIDPDEHVAEWQRHSEAMWSVFYREARDDYGYELLSPEDAAALGSERMKPLDQLADAVDAYWPQHIEAFRPNPEGGKHLLTFRGYYTAIFRPASRIAHGEVDALQPYLTVRSTEIIVSMTEREKFGRAPLAFPMMAFALLVYRHHFGWPDEARARQISDSMLYESDG